MELKDIFVGTRGSWHFMAQGRFYDKARGHTGEDFILPVGTPIPFPVDGEIVMVREQRQMGKCVYLRDENGYVWVYAHLSKYGVSQGDYVKKGEVKMISGNTGTATTAPHYHVEVISPVPWAKLEHMVRKELPPFTGWNVPPLSYYESLQKEQEHWSDKERTWAEKHKLVTSTKDPNAAVTWGELFVFTYRLVLLIKDWALRDWVPSWVRRWYGALINDEPLE